MSKEETTFTDLGLNKDISNNLKKNYIKTPTMIQRESFEPILMGENLIASARTGSGKTLAFLLPTIERIFADRFNISEKNASLYSFSDKHRVVDENILANKNKDRVADKKVLANKNKAKVLILSPTRELADQIDKSISMATGNRIKNLAVYGGKDIQAQINKLDNIDIITATPGRLFDHLNRKTIDLSQIETIIIDEVDNMLLMGFRKDIDDIIKFIKNKKFQILLFSATIDKQTKKMAYTYSDQYRIISLEKKEKPPKIKERFVETTDRKKYDDLFKILKEENIFMAIIFTRTKARADKLEGKMKAEGYNVEKIHSDISQNKRERTLRDFKNLKIQYIVATDLAQRGLDINGISHIINFDLPERVEDYTHRIGRTARMNKDGESISFITEKDLIYKDLLNKNI